MSGGLLGLSGFPIARDPSTQVTSGNEYANQAAGAQAGFAQQIANLPQVQTPDQYAQTLMQQQTNNTLAMFNAAGFNLGPDIANQTANAVSNSFYGDNLQAAYDSVGGQDKWNDWNRYYWQGFGNATDAHNEDVRQINMQAAAQAAADAAAAKQREDNRVTQQHGYSSLLGGGATGGILPNWNGLAGGSPTSTVQPGSVAPTSASAWGSTGLMGGNGYMGGGNTNTAASTPQTWSSTGQATQPEVSNLGMGSWGGPFSNKNPWSLG